jgi:hypothetical protein
MFLANDRRRLLVILIILVWGPLAAVHAARAADKTGARTKVQNAAADKAEKSKYLRIVRNSGDDIVGLETAIVSFAPATGKDSGVRVDLVAAVHVADKAYYKELNKRFGHYDVVLYELVAPEGTRIPKGGHKEKRAGNLISILQLAMKNMLELEFQLDEVDYTAKNLVHADLSPDQFTKSMHDGKESFFEMFARVLAYAMAKQNQTGGGDVDAFTALLEKNRALALKRLLAEQFEEMEGMMTAIDGPKGSTLISGRNKRVMEVLKKQIAAGKKKIAIFYGAGHMVDMEKRLGTDFSLKPTKTQWLKAWNME